MSDLRDLYQEMILDHYRRPRNFRPMENASGEVNGYNPLCGDRVKVFVAVRDGVVEDVSFQGSGCAISTASASMMTELVVGRTEAEAEGLFEEFHRLVTEGSVADEESLGKMAVFAGLSEYPARVKCATLSWHTMRAALKGSTDAISTE